MKLNTVICGDCLEVMRGMEDNSVDSIVTDPPYGWSFMGKKWDYNVPSVEIWQECLRVLKPGGFILCACGTRTQHRMTVNIEDAGFEIRDIVAWVYGSGFPKSHNIGKAIDKINGKPQPTEEFKTFLKEGKERSKLTCEQIDNKIGNGSGIFSQHYTGNNSQIEYPTKEKYEILKDILILDDSFDYLIDWAEAEREVIGKKKSSIGGTVCAGERNAEFIEEHRNKEIDITIPTTEEAKKYEGWGTALKPAMELWTLARKPLSESTVAQNVLKHGTGGINIDGCRVGMSEEDNKMLEAKSSKEFKGVKPFGNTDIKGSALKPHTQGRFPANLIHDGSEEVVGLFPDTKPTKPHGGDGGKLDTQNMGWGFKRMPCKLSDNGGSASRFFYCAKASKSERNKGLEGFEEKPMTEYGSIKKSEGRTGINTPQSNSHPTVKPISLMRYLCRLITPKDGTVLDCFTGSGSTGVACKLEGFNFIGIEKDSEYVKIAEARIKAWKKEAEQGVLGI